MASAEVALRFKVLPFNETKNFCLNDIFVGLRLLAGHRFEVRRFVKECVRANLSAPPNLFTREAYREWPKLNKDLRNLNSKTGSTSCTSRAIYSVRPALQDISEVQHTNLISGGLRKNVMFLNFSHIFVRKCLSVT